MSLPLVRWIRHLQTVWAARWMRDARRGAPLTALIRLLRLARSFADPQADAHLMPLRILLRYNSAALPASLRSAMERFERRLAHDPDRTQDARDCQERLLELTATTQHTEAHFERLTGHQLSDLPVQLRKPTQANRRLTERRRLRNAYRASRMAVRRPLMLTCAVVLCVLMVASHDADPLSRAVADVAASESLFLGNLGKTTRGASQLTWEERGPTARMVLDRIAQARTSILGFHTGYELSGLEEAAEMIDALHRHASALEPGSAAMYRLRAEIEDLLHPKRPSRGLASTDR